MTEEIYDDEILETELEDDALERRMRKLESEAARILRQSNELLKTLSSEPTKLEELPEENSEKLNVQGEE
jgi:hypothetical protein